MTRCSATRANGEQCKATALPGRSLCWAHDPEHREKALEARKAGGYNSSRAARAAKRAPRDMRDLAEHLLQAVGEVHRGDLDPKKATAMASLAGALVKVHEAGEVNERLAELERRLEAKGGWERRQG